MKKTGILNADIAAVVALMGHMDLIAIVDCGFPIPEHVRRIDLSISRGVPDIVQTALEIAKELEAEAVIYARESDAHCPDLIERVKGLFPGSESQAVNHVEFKQLCAGVKAIIRTGECIPYSNIILRAGVAF